MSRSPSGLSRSERAAGPGWDERFRRPLTEGWYDRPTLTVAEELLGKLLVHRMGSSYRVSRIVETEAYLIGDPASHSFRGPTARNRAMYEGPGTLYMFRIHQVHCANAVTRRGEAVLLRAAEPIQGIEEAMSGPGRLARALGLTSHDTGASLVRSELRLLAAPRPREPIARMPRVGIRRAREKPYRFALVGNLAVSRPRPALPIGTAAGRRPRSSTDRTEVP